MQITATMVKELRERTGAGMMECKKALTEANGDSEAAVEIMRKSGLAKADKKTSRVAAEGLVNIKVSNDNKTAVMVEVNSETDFVAKGDTFLEFMHLVTDVLLDKNIADNAALAAAPIKKGSTETVEEYRLGMVAKIGENIQVRRFIKLNTKSGQIGAYSHGGRIGVVAELTGGDAALAKDIAMHIAASNPVCVSEKDVPAEHLAKEKEILIAQSADSGKPAEIIEKMVEGRLKKYLAEVTLVGQVFVKDPDMNVGKLLKSANAEVKSFTRFEVGEGIEKKEDNFVEEVMAQARA